MPYLTNLVGDTWRCSTASYPDEVEVLLVTSQGYQTFCPFVLCRRKEIAASEPPNKVATMLLTPCWLLLLLLLLLHPSRQYLAVGHHDLHFAELKSKLKSRLCFISEAHHPLQVAIVKHLG